MLNGRCILFVYGEIDFIVVELQQALDHSGAETVIARTPADALTELSRFEFDAALINYRPGFDAQHRELLAALGGVRTLLLGTVLMPASLLAACPILLKPVTADAVVAGLARLQGSSGGEADEVKKPRKIE